MVNIYLVFSLKKFFKRKYTNKAQNYPPRMLNCFKARLFERK